MSVRPSSVSSARYCGRRRRSPPRAVHHQGERHQREQGEPRQRHRSRHRVQEVPTAHTGQQKNKLDSYALGADKLSKFLIVIKICLIMIKILS